MTTQQQLQDWLLRRVAEATGRPPEQLDIHQPLDSYGLSSRDAVALSGQLEEHLDRSLPATLVWEYPTIAGISAALLGVAAPKAADAAPPAASAAPQPAEPIAVVGLGCRLPGGVHGPKAFWDLLSSGREAISEVPEQRWAGHAGSPEAAEVLARTTRWGGYLDDITGFDADFFGISPREAAGMDPQQRLLLEVSWEALEHAGIAPAGLRGSRTGVFVGISGNEYGQLAISEAERIDAWSGTGAALSIAANRLSYVLDLRGPSVAVDSACSSSLVAVHLAMQSLRAGETAVALAGGVNLLLSPGVTVNFDQMGVTSPDGRCRAFDAAANGMVRAEGAGVVVLKRLSDARRDGDRVLAVLRGSAVNSDGRSNGITAPNPEAQEALLRTAYANAGIEPSEVDYVEAHGTGTLLGDPIEAGTLGAVLGAGRDPAAPLLIGSVKTNVGHLEAAAGITGLIKVVLALANDAIPASLHFTEPNPHIPFDRLGLAVASAARPWPRQDRPARAGVSGFGFGGTNAHVIVEEVAATASTSTAEGPDGYLLSGPSPERIRDTAGSLAEWLVTAETDLGAVRHALHRRFAGPSRALITASDKAELLAGLRTLAAGRVAPNIAAGRGDRLGSGVVWVFSGHGSQWTGMGAELLATEPAFADALSEVDELVQALAGFSPKRLLLDRAELDGFAVVQPTLFAVQVALAELWRSYDVRPDAVIGHSVGEVAAAVVSGALSLADGVRVVTARSRLAAALAEPGVMAVLELRAEEVAAVAAGLSDVDIAVHNAPEQTVVAGPAGSVARLVERVEASGRMARLVKVDVASHSARVEPVLPALAAELRGLRGRKPEIPFYSTVSERPAFDGGYWVANLRQPVRFADAVTKALAEGYGVFLEIAPHPVLAQAITETARAHGSEPVVLASLRRDEPERAQLRHELGRLRLAGHPLPRSKGTPAELPTTPWRHQPYWVAPSRRRGALPAGHPFLGTHLELPEDGRHLWSAEVGLEALPWLTDHRVDEVPVLPGVAYAEIALSAASAAFGLPISQVQASDVALHRPLALGARTGLTTVLIPGGDLRGLVNIYSRAEDDVWLLHATAKVAAAEPVSSTDPDPFDGSDVLAGEGIDRAELYRRLRALGQQHGPAFAGVTEVHATGDGCAAASVVLPEQAPPNPRFAAHPAVLDSCLQVLGAALPPAADNELHLPMEFGAIRVYGEVGRGGLCQVTVSGEGGGVLADVRLSDPDGRLVLEINGVFVRRVQRTELTVPLGELLLETVWQRADPPPGPVAETSGTWLVIGEDDRLTCDLSDGLLAAGRHPIVLSTVDITPELLTSVLDQTAPAGIVLVQPEPDGPEGLDAALRLTVAASTLVGALADRALTPRLWLLGAGGADVVGAELVRPAAAALRGLARVLAFEQPALRASWVDVDDTAAVTGLLTELLGGGTEDEVAWRGGIRYATRLRRATLPEPGEAPVVRSGGAYVVTGGLGGLGLVLARWLVERGAGKVVLNGRSNPNSAAQQVIADLRSHGALIEVVTGDIADPGVAERIVATAQDGASLRGVVHAAAVLDDRVLGRLDADNVRRVWRPKAYGAWRLHEATAGLPLDWWLGFSSAAALLGSPGQAAYAAANAYLDAITARRRGEGQPAATINWGTWAEVGLAADREVGAVAPITPEQGLTALEAVLASGRAATGVLRLDVRALAELFPAAARTPFFADLIPAAPAATPDWPGVSALSTVDPVEARRIAGGQLRARIAGLMGFAAEALPADTPLTGLGLDSLLAVRVKNAVQHDFDLTLATSVLLRGASLAELESWLFAELALGARESGPAKPVLVPPRDAAERLVGAVWQEVLVRPVGVTETFEAAGGTPVQAERIAALLAERSGRTLRVDELFAVPTVEGMARWVREREVGSGQSPLRVLRRDGGQPPLFFFHPAGGDTAVYRQLVDLLDADQPAYGLDRVDHVRELTEKAGCYLDHVRAVAPHGPYRLAGWSLGGFLAYEVAQQLTAAGAEVELVAMFDSLNPLPLPAGLDEVRLAELRFRRFADFLETSYGRRIELPYDVLARLGDEEQIDLLIEQMTTHELVNVEVSTAILHHQRTSFLDTRVLERYQPELYDGRVVLYSAADKTPGGLKDPRFDRDDPPLGWDEFCPGLEVIRVPGHHLSVLDPPNVEAIATHLRDLLRSLTPTPHHP
ncbi:MULTISPECIES: type I polyketide synthase [unclassified Crossiella]|uniref:type I polyketide synthase n=1 Tax=unclassified Crossiella TaxID=2620835 RepID=UPI00200052D4|nr:MULTISPECIES: type I polyketide synthase [unclassified Crossiella]MCK2237258.1 SDR family NAD(P)-dependent oxidoreductase [Crossiella sp. S99.2]MCK2250913.1 SDR family NAD(P)-dependent oxidoreductase [Crossiella sp. S99.1]